VRPGDRGAAPGPALQGLRVLDEALRLLDALQAQRPPAGAAPEQPGASSPADQHLGGECRVCPVCRGLAALREVNPDALGRMGRALADLAGAVGEFAGGPAQEPEGTGAPDGPAPPRRVRLHRIDVTD
jgi:hypothetical protein